VEPESLPVVPEPLPEVPLEPAFVPPLPVAPLPVPPVPDVPVLLPVPLLVEPVEFAVEGSMSFDVSSDEQARSNAETSRPNDRVNLLECIPVPFELPFQSSSS
jgi:hypothetical protein